MGGKRRNTIDDKGRRGSAMVSTITMQDGKELEIYKKENEKLRAQLSKIKNSLNTVRRQSIKPRTTSKVTQTIAVAPSSDSDESEESEESSQEDEPEQIVEEIEKKADQPRDNKKIKPVKAKKKVIRVVKTEKIDDPEKPPLSDSSELSESTEEEVVHEMPEMTKEEINKQKQERADSMVSNLKSYVRKKDR